MSEFKVFLLNESKEYLAQKIGDVLSALQSLEGDSRNMGNRQLVRTADHIVNQMRRVLGGRWSKQEQKYLLELQRAAVALAKAVDENAKMAEVIASVKGAVESLVGKMGVPVNQLAGGDEPPGKSQDQLS